MRAADLVCV